MRVRCASSASPSPRVYMLEVDSKKRPDTLHAHSMGGMLCESLELSEQV